MPQGTLHRITQTETGSHGVIETMDRQMPFLPFDVDYRLDLLKIGDPVRYELPLYRWESTQRGAIRVQLDAERAEFLRIQNKGNETDGK
jgi:hypothetical protein